MKNIKILLLIVSLVLGCATLNPYPSKKANLDNKLQEYLKNPDYNIFIVIDTISDKWVGPTSIPIQCTYSINMMSDPFSNQNSFIQQTPFFIEVPINGIKDSFNKLYNEHNKLPESKKPIAMLQMQSIMPSFNYVFQSQSERGIKGELYFNGKVVSSSSANVPYGIVTLKYQIKPEDFIK